MFGKLKSAGIAALMAATTLGFAAQAEARDRWRDGDNDAAVAIGAGIVGLALGAMIADRDDDRYYDRGYYDSRRYVRVRGRPDYYYYYDNNPNRYYRDRYYGRNYRYYDNRGRYGRNDRWQRGYDRVDRWYGNNRNGYRYGGRNDDRRYDRRHWRD